MSSVVTVDKQLLQEVIGNENAEINDLEVIEFCDAGENFTGILKGAKFSIISNGNKRDYDIVLKFARKMAAEGVDLGSILFYKEISFYKKFIPYIENWQREKFGAVQYPIPAPKSLFGCFDRKLLVLDNLKQYGFKNAKKMYGLNFERCSFTLKAVAAFHALSVCFVQDYGESRFLSDFDYFKDSFLDFFENEEMVKVMRDMDNNLLESVNNLLTNAYPEEVSNIKSLIEYGKNHYIPDNLKKYSLPNDKFNVIGHGDLWTNNILFKFDEDGKPIDIKFIDFQLLRYSTPASDLIYFIWMSGDKDVLVNKQDELLKIYYASLESELEKLNIKLTYTIDELVEDYYSFIDFGILQCAKVSLLFDAKKEDALQLDEAENMLSQESLAKFSNSIDEISNVASETVKEKLINVVRYGKRMNLY